MFGYFDKEYQLELLRKREREEGREEGGLDMLIFLVKDKIVSISEAAKRADMTPEEFAEAAKLKLPS